MLAVSSTADPALYRSLIVPEPTEEFGGVRPIAIAALLLLPGATCLAADTQFDGYYGLDRILQEAPGQSVSLAGVWTSYPFQREMQLAGTPLDIGLQ